METVSAVPFKRSDITAVASTNRGCLRVLPQGKKAHKQKLVIGDMKGVLSSFSVGKALDVKSEFVNEPTPKPISRITLHESQIFAANGATVAAYSRKGEQFFLLETTMSEEIKLLSVRSPFLYIGGTYMMTAFNESSEKGFYMAPDKMNDATLDPNTSGPTANSKDAATAAVFLGCQDRQIRRVHHGSVTAEISCEAPVSALHFSYADRGADQDSLVHYGTVAGTISCVRKLSNEKLETKWSYIPQERSASVSAIMTCNLSQNGVPDIAVAREDGTVQVFQPVSAAQQQQSSSSDNSNLPLAPILTSSLGEFVSALDCGCITAGDHEDIVVSTFSGKVVSLGVPMQSDFVVPQTSGGGGRSVVKEIQKVNPDKVNDDTHTLPQASQLKIDETKKEITDLQEKLHDAKIALAKIQAAQTGTGKSKAQQTQQEASASAAGGITSVCKLEGATTNFGVVDRFNLDETSGDLVITTELDVPLGSVCVSSEVVLNIVEEQSDSCSSWTPAIVSNATNKNRIKFLGVFRCGTADAHGMPKRLEVRFRCDEGSYGELSTTIHTLDKSHGAASRLYNVPPLSRHVRLSPADVPKEPFSTNAQFAKLYITGAFSIKDAHSWVHSCLMDIPERISGEHELVKYHFRNMYINSLLEVSVAKGELVAYSQNAMTLRILRDHVTRQATQKKVAVRIESDMKPEAVDVLIWLGIEIWRGLSVSASQYELIDALKEIESQEGEAAARFLSPQLKDILTRQKELQQKAKHHERDLAELKDYLKRWLADACVYAQSSESSQLEKVIDNFSRLLDAPVNNESETHLRMFVRDVCFPPPRS